LPGIAWDRSSAAAPRDSSEAAFWTASDPDLTTPENEVQLDFWSRVALATLLFDGPRGLQWDMRAELLARYGVPPRVELPPPAGIDDDLLTYLSFALGKSKDRVYYPYHEQTWIYPELGIRAEIWDRSLRESYVLPVDTRRPADPRPNPALLAGRSDLIALDDGRGVYRTMAPGVTPLRVRGSIARFPAGPGTRLVFHLDAPAEAAASLDGSWVVVDADGHEVARGSGALALSACAPGARRIAQFEAEVGPGDYRVDLAAAGGGRRGVVRLRARVERAAPGLAMSDLVLLCGVPVTAVGDGPLLIEPDFAARQDERSASVYFEAQHLAVDSTGRSRFSYRYSLRAVDAEERRPGHAAAFEAAREEDNVGPLRRQVVTAPIAALPRGTYDFGVEVHDLISGASARRSVRFVKA
jgi:hypothetical protein